MRAASRSEHRAHPSRIEHPAKPTSTRPGAPRRRRVLAAEPNLGSTPGLGRDDRHDLPADLAGHQRPCLLAALARDRAQATVSGSSRLGRSGTASALSAQGSGASDLELADLHLHDLDIKLSGSSHGSVNVTGTIAAQVSGASKLTYTSPPQFTKRDTSRGSSIQPV
jgi:Putative auto-transporter adhesin, head GIN domain